MSTATVVSMESVGNQRPPVITGYTKYTDQQLHDCVKGAKGRLDALTAKGRKELKEFLLPALNEVKENQGGRIIQWSHDRQVLHGKCRLNGGHNSQLGISDSRRAVPTTLRYQ